MLLETVASGVHRIEDAYTNWYLVEDGGRYAAYDTGLPRSWEHLHEALDRLGATTEQLDAIVLTHGHFDHVGFAERARRELDIDVWVHELDAGLVHHPLSYDHERSRAWYLVRPRSVPIGAALVRAGALRVEPVEQVRTFRAGQVLDVPGSPVVLATPGHTHGHCSFHLPDRDVVIAGDALVTLDPYTGRRGPRLVARAATADVRRDASSLDAIAATGASIVLTGHGDPWRGGAAEAVRRARIAGAA